MPIQPVVEENDRERAEAWQEQLSEWLAGGVDLVKELKKYYEERFSNWKEGDPETQAEKYSREGLLKLIDLVEWHIRMQKG